MTLASYQNKTNALGFRRWLGSFGVTGDGQRYETTATSFDPDGQVWDTMPLVQAYSSVDSSSPLIQSLASSYQNAMPGASPAAIAWQATKDHLIFSDDQSIASKALPGFEDFVVEVLRRPVDVVLFNRFTGSKAEGDCDDHSMLSAAVGAALGAEVEFVTVAADPREPGVLSHIYTVIDGLPCDASHGDYPGWEVPANRVSRRVTFGLRPSAPLWILAAAVAWYVFGPWIRSRFA